MFLPFHLCVCGFLWLFLLLGAAAAAVRRELASGQHVSGALCSWGKNNKENNNNNNNRLDNRQRRN